MKLFSEYHEKLVAAGSSCAVMSANFVKFSKDHLEIIEKFGRYPARNDVLGR